MQQILPPSWCLRVELSEGMKKNAKARQLASLALARAARHAKGRVAYTEDHSGPPSERTERFADASVAMPVGSGDAVAFGGGSEDEFSEPRSPKRGEHAFGGGSEDEISIFSHVYSNRSYSCV